MKPNTVGRISGQTHQQIPSNAKGLSACSTILTMDGEKPVGDIRPGDRVITRDSGMAIVKSVHTHHVLTAAIRIAAGSLGHTRPDRDVTLPAGQLVLVRDWRAQALVGKPQALVPVELLVDGEFVCRQDPHRMTLCEIAFDRPHILYVDGLELASHIAQPAASAAA